MSKILVTGGAGYIGSHTIKQLLAEGHAITALDSLELGHKEVFEVLSKAELVVGNIADTSLVTETIRRKNIDAVIHFAAYASVPESVSTPQKYYQNNIISGLSLLESIRETGIKRVIFSSSAATYGEPQYTPIDEAHTQLPTNPYGQTKLDFEHALRWYGQAYGIKSVSLRYFCAAGADPEGELGEEHLSEGHLIPLTVLTALGRRESISVFGTDYPTPDGTAVRDYIHVSDLASAHLLALQALEDGAETTAYNVGTGTGYSVREVITTTQKICGHTVPLVEKGRRVGDPSVLVASSEKIRRELGWSPKFSDIETMIGTAYTWFKKHPQGYATREKQ